MDGKSVGWEGREGKGLGRSVGAGSECTNADVFAYVWVFVLEFGTELGLWALLVMGFSLECGMRMLRVQCCV